MGALSAIATIVKAAAHVVPHVLDYLAHRRVQKKAERMAKKVDEAKRPDKSEDETAKAAKELENEISGS